MYENLKFCKLNFQVLYISKVPTYYVHIYSNQHSKVSYFEII